MIKMAIYLILGLVLFCVSAAGSWFLQTQVLDKQMGAAGKSSQHGGRDGEEDHAESSDDHGDAAAGHGASGKNSAAHGAAESGKAAADHGAAAGGHGAAGKSSNKDKAGADKSGQGAAAHGAPASDKSSSKKPSEAAGHGAAADTAGHGASGAAGPHGSAADGHANSGGEHGDASVSAGQSGALPFTPAVLNVATNDLPEDAIRYGEFMLQRERKVKEGEQKLDQERQRLEILKADLQAAKQEIHDLQLKLEGDLSRAQEMIQLLNQARKAWQEEKEAAESARGEMEKSRTKIETNEVTELKSLSQTLGALDAETAAKQVETFVNNGEVDRVSKALKLLELRKTAQIIKAIGNPEIENSLIEKMSKIAAPEEPAPAKGKRR